MTGLIGTIQQLETANATPDPDIWAKSLSGFGVSERDQTYNLGNLTGYASGVFLKDDGTVMAVGSMTGTLDDYIIQYDLGTAFTINSNVSVSTTASDHLDVNPPMGLIGGLSVAGGGTRVYAFGRSSNEVSCFHLSTAWDFSTGGAAQSGLNTSSKISNVYGGHVKEDGTEVYVVGYSPSSGSADKIYQYSLSTAHDLSSASFTGEFDYSSKVPVAGCVHFHSNGYAFVVGDISSDKLHKYNLSTAWDITTASFHSSSDALTTDAPTLSGVWFDDDWTKIYYADQNTDDVYRIPLVTLIAAPSNFTATAASTSQINLSWSASSGTGSVTYTIQRSTNASSGFSQIATGLTGTTYSDTGRNQGTRYYYKVNAVDDNGAGSTSSANQFTLPGQVGGLSASAASSSQINLSWNAPIGTQTGYQVYRSTNANMSGQTLLATVGLTSYNATGLSASTTYYFRVRAVNNGGNGAYSSIANATTQAAGSNPPTHLAIKADSSLLTGSNTLEAEQLNTTSLGANPVADIDASDWNTLAGTATMAINYGPDYSDTLTNNSGALEFKMYGYINATNATSFQWDVSGATVDVDTFSAINSLAISGTASTSQNATSSGIGETVKINHNSGGRGYLLMLPAGSKPPGNVNDAIHFDIDASASNSGGTTSATQLTITVESQ